MRSPNQDLSPENRAIPEAESEERKVFDLEERTALLGEAVVKFAHRFPRTPVFGPLVNQLVRSSTSIGANYMEACGAESGKDFDHKIAICRKESNETLHWLRMIVAANPEVKVECRRLWSEAHELALIFSAILRKRRARLRP